MRFCCRFPFSFGHTYPGQMRSQLSRSVKSSYSFYAFPPSPFVTRPQGRRPKMPLLETLQNGSERRKKNNSLFITSKPLLPMSRHYEVWSPFAPHASRSAITEAIGIRLRPMSVPTPRLTSVTAYARNALKLCIQNIINEKGVCMFPMILVIFKRLNSA